jgi:hypothetical protein
VEPTLLELEHIVLVLLVSSSQMIELPFQFLYLFQLVAVQKVFLRFVYYLMMGLFVELVACLAVFVLLEVLFYSFRQMPLRQQ